MSTSREIRRAEPADLEMVVKCLTSAFFDDPVWGLWSFPDADTRADRLGRLLGFWARAGIRHGWSWLAGTAQASAIWVPPGAKETTSEDDAAFGPLVDELFEARAPAANDLFASFEAHHPDEEPHYYLSLLGTHRDHAGQGSGMALLRENLRRIDEDGMPAYLESTNPANIPRYESLGFRPRERFGAPGGPVVTSMWRPAG